MTLLIIYLTLAVGVSFLCSVLEAVLLSITPSFIEQKMQHSPRGGAQLKNVKEQLDRSISSILILNTFAHTMGAAGVGAQALQLFGEQWETVIAVLLTLVILYVSEIIPKTIGATFWRQLAVPSAVIINWLVKLVWPLVWLSTFITRVISSDKSDRVSREEIIAYTTLGFKGGALGHLENGLVNNILMLREITTQHILTPRTVVQAFDKASTIEEALQDEKTKHFSRFPVFDETIDNIIGVVMNRDLLQGVIDNHQTSTVGELAKPVFRVSQQLPVLQLLDLFTKRNEHIFIVEDEFGQTAGIVTLEDAVETLIGREIIDESDSVADLQELAKRKFRERIAKRQNFVQFDDTE